MSLFLIKIHVPHHQIHLSVSVHVYVCTVCESVWLTHRMAVHYTLPGIDFPVLVSSWNEKNFSNVTLFDRRWVCVHVCLSLCVLFRVFYYSKNQTRLLASWKVMPWLHLKISAHMVHTNTHIHSVFSMSGQWRGSEGWAEPSAWSVKWGKEAVGCADSIGVKRWKTATEVRRRQKCTTNYWTERSAIRPETEREGSYHLLWFWAVWGC